MSKILSRNDKEKLLLHYDFAHILRGFAAVIVVLGAHILGIFWLNTPAACTLLGVKNCSVTVPIPSIVMQLNHFLWFSYGHFGVALFFLISGFVIPFSLIRLRASQFLIARFFRIYPTYWLALFCTILMLIALHHGVLWFGINEVLFQAAIARDLAWIPSSEISATPFMPFTQSLAMVYYIGWLSCIRHLHG